MTIYRQPVVNLTMSILPYARAIDLIRHAASISAGTVVLYVTLNAVRRKQHGLILILGTVLLLCTLLIFDLLAPSHARSGITTPQIPILYWWLFFGFKFIANTLAAYVCFRYRPHGGDWSIRMGLTIFGLAMTSCDVLWIVHLAYTITRNQELLSYISPLMGVQSLLVAIAAGLPLLQGVQRFYHNHQHYQQLRPLWNAVTAATPHIVQTSVHFRYAIFVPPQLLESLLYRRVIEIRDAILALSWRLTPNQINVITEAVDTLKLPSAQRPSVILAASLHQALNNRHPNLSSLTSGNKIAENGGEQLEQEVDFLLSVAKQFRSSTIRTLISD
jgi:hypothetical protein